MDNFINFKVLQDQHEQFRESLQQAEDDMRTLRRLDKQIKSYHVSINPYVHAYHLIISSNIHKYLMRILMSH